MMFDRWELADNQSNGKTNGSGQVLLAFVISNFKILAQGEK